jgi:8-oxo-dGTP diphosphatase
MQQSERKCPLLTVDIIIELIDQNNQIVLVNRKNPPYGWALPGGFVDIGETTMHAAAREALEEVSLKIAQLEQFHTYSDPARDERGHGVTVTYIAKAIGTPCAADDAKEVKIVDPTAIPFTVSDTLCFDHAPMIVDYLIFKQTGQRPTRE